MRIIMRIVKDSYCFLNRASRFPNGLGKDSVVLGKHVLFHNHGASKPRAWRVASHVIMPGK